MNTITTERKLLEQAYAMLSSNKTLIRVTMSRDEICVALRAALAAPATAPDRHAQELLAMEITLQNMRERHAQEICAYELTVQNLRDQIASAPAWHDAPTEPGIWLCDEGGPDCYTYTAHNIVLLNDPALKDDECRWYGPIPQGGAKAEGGAA